MKILQKKYTPPGGWEILRGEKLNPELYNFVLVFGCPDLLYDPAVYKSIRKSYPNAIILLASTAGEIIDTQVNDNSISLTAVIFEKTILKTAEIEINSVKSSYEAGEKIALQFDPVGLKNVFVISDGQKVNGSDFVNGMQEFLPKGTIITGGLAGDGTAFKRTLVGLNEPPLEGKIAAIGFYGENLSVGHGSVGGWSSFGPDRLITKSKANVLYELDGKPVLDIYKTYLGDYAKELPSSGLLFPLSIRNGNNNSLVRTILSIDEEEKSMTFAGNVPQGYYARLMKANFDKLIEGASLAAQNTVTDIIQKPELAILISCVGRKLVLDQRVEEEIEVIRETFGPGAALTGFYSYGEISPSHDFLKCELHNQTMTITTFSEY